LANPNDYLAPTPNDNTLPSGLNGEPPPEALAAPAATPAPDAAIAPPDVASAAGAPPVPVSTLDKQYELDKKRAGIEEDQAIKAANAAQEQDETARIAHADYLERRQAAQDKLDAATQEFTDKGQIIDPRTKDSKAKSLLAIAFGGLGAAFRSAGGGSSNNDVLTQLQKKWDDDTDRQKANIAIMKDNVVQARTGLSDVDEGRRELQNAENAKNLSNYNLALKQGEAQLKNLGFSQADIDNDNRIKQLRIAQDAAKAKALKEADEHALTQARIGALNAKAGKDRGHGGGGSGASHGAAAEELARRIRVGNPDGTPLSNDQQIHAANELHIPLEGKAGVTTLNTIRKESTFNADQERKGGLANRLLSKETEAWAKENGVNKIAEQQRELGGLIKVLKDNEGNPLAQKLALEKAVSAARGGAASKQALSLALDSMGGSLDKAEGFIQHVATGGLGGKQLENFNAFLNGQLGNAQNEGKEKYDAFTKYIETQPPAKQKALLEERSRLFSGLHGFGGKNSGKGATSEAPSPDQDSKAVAWAKAHLSDPQAKEILRANGAL
jgi:hypothetical protein